MRYFGLLFGNRSIREYEMEKKKERRRAHIYISVVLMTNGIGFRRKKKHQKGTERHAQTPEYYIYTSCSCARELKADAKKHQKGGREVRRAGTVWFDRPRAHVHAWSQNLGGFQQSSLIGAGRFGRVYEGTLRDGMRVKFTATSSPAMSSLTTT
jgi:hypothetical protein